MQDFTDKEVLIVGGSSGVGRATANAFAAANARVTIASRSRSKLTAAAKLLGPSVESRVLDICDSTAVDAFFTPVRVYDHVVVSAAETPMGPVAGLTMAEAHAAMDSKFWGTYHVARAVSLSESGSLTFVSGYLSQRPSPAAALQSAINAALEALARGLALERAPVRVNTVSPGLLRTPLWDGLPEDRREAMYQSAIERLPVHRVGRPEDVADAILLLAGNAYCTGTTLFVDGGGCIA